MNLGKKDRLLHFAFLTPFQMSASRQKYSILDLKNKDFVGLHLYCQVEWN